MVEAACESLPPVLVHGDLKDKNLRVRGREGRDHLLVLDWELAGWGSPVPELERLSPDRTGPAAARLVGTYLEHAGWTNVDRRAAVRLACIGAMIRMAACIEWASLELGLASEDKAIRQLRHYEERLTMLLSGLRRGGR